MRLLILLMLVGCNTLPPEPDDSNPWIRVLRHDGPGGLGGFRIDDPTPEQTREAIPVLARAVNDADPNLRDRSVVLLSQIGPAAEPAVPIQIARASCRERV